MLSSLENWLKNGWIVERQTSQHEISELLRLIDRDLTDCQVSVLSSDWKFSIAYNAALQSARAALAAAGYRPARDLHHYRVIQSLRYTIRAEENLIAKFDAFRKKRNISDYDRAGTISDKEIEEIILLATYIRAEIEKWIKNCHPELLLE